MITPRKEIFKKFPVKIIGNVHFHRTPAIRNGNVQIPLALYPENRRNLGMEGGAALVFGMRISQNAVGAVPGTRNSDFGRIGLITCRTAGDQIVPSAAHKMRRGFPHIRRSTVRKVCTIVAGYIGIVLGQVGADRLAVDTLKIAVSLSVLSDGQIKVTCAHIQRTQPLSHLGIWPQQRVSGKNGH